MPRHSSANCPRCSSERPNFAVAAADGRHHFGQLQVIAERHADGVNELRIVGRRRLPQIQERLHVGLLQVSAQAIGGGTADERVVVGQFAANQLGDRQRR